MSKKFRRARTATKRTPRETAQLIEACREGEAVAAQQVFDRYVERLTALARKRISSRLASRFGASDVVMSAYRSFFAGVRRNQFAVASERELWQLLVQITLRKLYRQVERHTAAKRTTGRNVSQNGDGDLANLIGNQQPSPAEAAALIDELQLVLKSLPPIARRVLELRLQGEEILNIAIAVQTNERTVRRWLKRAQETIQARWPERFPQSTTNLAAIPPQPVRRKVRRVAVALPTQLPAIDETDFLLERMLGAGAGGKVYRAVRRSTGQAQAIKFLHKSLSANAASVRRFLAECLLVSQLQHPNIMPVLGCGRTQSGIYFFAMPLAIGDLQHHSRRSSLRKILTWIMQAALGVEQAHARGIVHGDLKPSNLLISPNSHVLVSDFGLARHLDEQVARGGFGGTPAFMAPEQIAPQWGRISPRTDIYGLGATLFALLTGRPPYIGERPSEIFTQVISPETSVSPRTIRRSIPEDVDALCRRCLSKRSQDRFATTQELITALQNCI